LNRWKNYSSQLLNVQVYRISDVRQIGIYTAEPLIPDPSPFEGEIVIADLKSYISPDSDEIPAELFQAGGKTLRKEAYYSAGRDVLYNILTEVGVSMNLVWLTKMCLNGIVNSA
jgi:hypothetical protein